jgi:hypothetical protein
MTHLSLAATALTQALQAGRLQSSQHGDSCLAQNTFYHVVCQARGVVVKMEKIFPCVVTKFLKAVSIGELAQRAEMVRLEAFLQFVSNGH